MGAVLTHVNLPSDRTACLVLPRDVVGRRPSIIINALTALANASATAQIITLRKPCTNDSSIADFNDEAVALSMSSGSFTPASLARWLSTSLRAESAIGKFASLRLSSPSYE